MNGVKHIEIDLNTFKIVLQFQNANAPLILHFDTPSRKFYLSLVALIVHEMKQQDRPGFVYVRKHEYRLKFLDDALAGSYASGTIDGMWEKIRKAWHYSLPIWSEIYDREMKDIFDTQENIAKEIACSLKSRLGCESDEPITKRHTNSPEAFQMYLKGRLFEDKRSFQRAITYFNKAIEIDPNFALAYAELGYTYGYFAYNFYSKPYLNEYYFKAKAAINKALEIDRTLSDAYSALAYLLIHFDFDWKGVEDALKNALAFNPGSAKAHKNHYSYLKAKGRFDEALAVAMRSQELDPLSITINTRLGEALHLSGKYEESLKHLEELDSAWPDDMQIMWHLGRSYTANKKFDKAIVKLERTVDLNNRKSSLYLSHLAIAYAFSGKRDKAINILNEALLKYQNGEFPPHSIAVIYGGLGDKEKVFEWLERAYDAHDPRQYPIKSKPIFKSIHSDPRWSEMMKKMGLEG